MNSEGGALVLGVDDTGQILGVEKGLFAAEIQADETYSIRYRASSLNASITQVSGVR